MQSGAGGGGGSGAGGGGGSGAGGGGGSGALHSSRRHRDPWIDTTLRTILAPEDADVVGALLAEERIDTLSDLARMEIDDLLALRRAGNTRWRLPYGICKHIVEHFRAFEPR